MGRHRKKPLHERVASPRFGAVGALPGSRFTH